MSLPFDQKGALVDSIIALKRQADTARGALQDKTQRLMGSTPRRILTETLEAIVRDCDTFLDAEPGNPWAVEHRSRAQTELDELRQG